MQPGKTLLLERSRTCYRIRMQHLRGMTLVTAAARQSCDGAVFDVDGWVENHEYLSDIPSC